MQSRMTRIVTVSAVLALALIPGVASGQAKNPCGGAEDGVGKMVPVDPAHAKLGTIFYVHDKVGRDVVSFSSDAPLESFVGTTNQIFGYVAFDPEDPTRGGKGMFQVPVASIDTGIPLRDEHLRSEAWLGAERNPLIKYEITGTKDLKDLGGKGGARNFELVLVGTFHCNGKSKALDVPAKISYMKESDRTKTYAPGDLLKARARFSINLGDFGISGPPGMDLIGSKVGATPEITVGFTASSKNPGAANPCNPGGGEGKEKGKAENPCNPCGGKAKGGSGR